MRKEDLKDLSREQLERLICEWAIRYHRLEEETVKSQKEKIDSLLKELEEEKRNTITISDGAITMRADMWESLNENKALKDENINLKHHIEDLEEERIKLEKERDKLIDERNNLLKNSKAYEFANLQDQHQQDCIRINDLRTAYLVTLDELARLREQFGAGK